MTEQYEYLTIGLPIPIDVFGALGSLIDKAWPGSAIITNPTRAGVPDDVIRRLGHHNGAIIRITKKKPKPVSKKAAQEIVAEHTGDGEPLDVLGVEDEWLRLAPPEDLTRVLGGIMMRVLDGFEGAANYVEWVVHPPEDPSRALVLSAARSKGQTPGELRQRAEAELEATRGRNETLADLLREAMNHVEECAITEDFWDRASNALGDPIDAGARV